MTAVMVGTEVPADDGALVAAVLAGDQGSADDLFRRYHARLVRRMGYWTRDRAHAEDLAQDAWLKAFSALNRFDMRAPFWPWLRRIGDNTARTELRRTLAPCGRHRTITVSDTTLDLVPSRDDHARVEDGAEVAAALAGIPARQRDAFLAVAHNGTPIAVAADEFGLNENAFRQLYHRARLSLRERVDTVLGTAPVLWLQRWVTTFRDALENPTSISGLQAGAAAVGTAIALLVIAPGGALSAAADERDQVIAPVQAAERSVDRASKATPKAARGTQAQVAIPRRQADVGGAGTPATGHDRVSVPKPPIAAAPVRLHQQRPEDPTYRYGVRPAAAGVGANDVVFEVDEADDTLADHAVCKAAGATPATFCD